MAKQSISKVSDQSVYQQRQFIAFASHLMVADDSRFLHTKSKYYDKNERVPRFI